MLRSPNRYALVEAAIPKQDQSQNIKPARKDRSMMLVGGCLCGEVRFEADPPDLPIGYCHCVICRPANIAAFISRVGIARGDFHWTAGEQKITSYESSFGALRHFCSVCGSYLGDERSAPARFVVRLTALDDDLTLEPTVASDR
jgi:hypothetical protein